MQFALLIYHTPEEFDMRRNDYSEPHLGAWRAYYKALVEAKVYVGANALELPETGTTVRVKEGKRRVQDGPYADTKEQLAGLIILELASVDAALEWAARCPGAVRAPRAVLLLTETDCLDFVGLSARPACVVPETAPSSCSQPCLPTSAFPELAEG